MEEVTGQPNSGPTDSTKADAAQYVDLHGATQQAFLRAQYEDTQKMFAEQNVSSVTLYRAQATPARDVNGLTITQGDAMMRPLSSWSTSYASAMEFGNNVYAAQVPVSQILSTARTGFGCLNEHEMVVIGDVKDVSSMNELTLSDRRKAFLGGEE